MSAERRWSTAPDELPFVITVSDTTVTLEIEGKWGAMETVTCPLERYLDQEASASSAPLRDLAASYLTPERAAEIAADVRARLTARATG